MQTMLCPFCMKHVETDICPFCGNPINYTGHHTHLPVGFTLQGRSAYVLGAAKGQGGFGITYIALDMASGNRVAIKEYYPSHCCGRTHSLSVESGFGQEETFTKGKEHFILEAQMLQSLSDLPTVVKVLDYFEANSSAYLVMEYLDGLCLKDHVEKNGKLPAQAFLKQMQPLMADMEKMHRRGVVHRDIAPDNIILLPDGRLKLIDFGAARSYVGDKSMTVVVKKGFAPVEQYMRKGSNASTDVYALAATIYYCITGIVPPDSAERQYGEAELLAPTSIGVELSHAQELALEKALEIQPKERTQTVAELAKALEQAPKPVPPKPEKTTPVPKKAKVQKSQPAASPKEKTKKKTKWWIPVAAAAAVLCIGAGILFTGKDTPSAADESAKIEAAPTELHPVAQLSAEAQKYNEAVDFFNNGEYGKAAIAFGKLGDYRDAKEISRQIWDAIAKRETIAAGGWHTVALMDDGTVLAEGKNYNGYSAPVSPGQCDVDEWKNIIALAVGPYHTVGLKSDGTVEATGLNTSGECDVYEWTDIVDISAGLDYTVGLKSDGTVMYTGNSHLADAAKEWRDIVLVSGCVGLKADGTVVQAEYDHYDLRDWSDIISIRNTRDHVMGLKSNGTVIVAGTHDNGVSCDCDVNGWTNIVSVALNGQHVVGLKADGTIISSYSNVTTVLDSGKWTNIAVMHLSYGQLFCIKTDHSLVTGSSNHSHRQLAQEWTNIKLPADRDTLLSEIKVAHITSEDVLEMMPSGLSAEATAYNEAVRFFKNEEYGKAAIAFGKLGDYRDAKELSRRIWDAIADRDTISTGRTHTVGIRNDGTLVACGTNSYGESNVDNISDAIAVTVDGTNTFVLHSDGTVTSTSWWYDYDLSQWNDIVAIKAHHTSLMGLKADGTIIVTNPVNYDCYGSVSTWLESVHDIVSIEPVGLIPLFVNSDGAIVSFDGGKLDGTKIDYSQTQNWKNVISVVGGSGTVYALTEDGTVSKAVINEAQHQNSWEENEVNVDGWSDIIKISGSTHFLGLKSDGTVVATGRNLNKECQTENWTDVVAVSAGWLHSVGLKSDGTVVTAGTTKDGLGMASKWSDIKLPADRDALLAAIELDYITE